MLNPDAPLVSLYEWTLRLEEELSQRKPVFPPVLKTDHDRLEMSLRALRISLELRVKAFPTVPLAPYQPPSPVQGPSPDLPC